MSFISLQINIGTKTDPDWQQATLKDDAQISVEDTSAVWDTDAGGGAFSYEFELPVEDNLNILGSSCDMRGRNIYKQLYGKQFRLYCGGLCMFYGIVKLDDEVEVEQEDDSDDTRHTIGISLASDNYEWDDMLDGVSARDVDLATSTKNSKNINVLDSSCTEANLTKIKIGYCVPSYFPVEYYIVGLCKKGSKEDSGIIGYTRESINTGFYIPKILISNIHSCEETLDKTDFTNTNDPYNPDNPLEHPYCNVRICYQHYVQDSSDSSASWTQKRGYSIGAPDRVNSAPCFYVMFWMHLFFRALGVNVKNNCMLSEKYQDFRRLAFYHTNCGYEEIQECYTKDAAGNITGDGMYLQECPYDDDDLDDLDIGNRQDGMVGKMEIIWKEGTEQRVLPIGDDQTFMMFSRVSDAWDLTKEPDVEKQCKRIDYYYLLIQDSSDLIANNAQWVQKKDSTNNYNRWVCNKLPLYSAYANSENFPDTDAKEILDGLQNAFGIRYLYNAKEGTLDIILVKDILTQETITDIACDIHKVTMSENHVTGFRLKYSSTEDTETNAITLKENLTGVIKGTEGSDTTYSYNNYTNVKMLDPKGSNIYGNNQNKEKKGYGWLLNNVTYYDKTCYLHPTTGNAFRIKVNGDASGGQELYPSLFEVGQFQKAEWGDCSNTKSNKDFIEEVSIGFAPIIENDVNCVSERVNNPDSNASATGQILAQLVDGEFRSYSATDTSDNGASKEGDFTVSSVKYDMPFRTWESYNTKEDSDDHKTWNKCLVTPTIDVVLYLAGLTTWDLTGDEPTEDNDTGYTLGIMRGSGSDSHTELFDEHYDGVTDNIKWCNLPGTQATFSADCVDQYGNFYDYNGIAASSGETSKTREEAVSEVEALFPDSNTFLVPDKRTYTYNAKVYSITLNHVTYYFIMVLTDVDGTTLTESKMNDYVNNDMYYYYINHAELTSFREADMAVGCRMVATYTDGDEAQKYCNILNQYGAIIFGRASTIDLTGATGVNGLGYDTVNAISLRLKAEKTNPGYDTTGSSSGYTYSEDKTSVTSENGTTVPNSKHFPIDNSCAKRGLADKFYNEYAYWVLNRKIANITCTMELADLINIDMTKKYRIGGYEGFIKSLSYTLDNETGLSPVDIEFYYL